MRVLEFGDRSREKILLIHGLNIPWQMWEREIESLRPNYHVIVPALSGHDTQGTEPFVSVEQEAQQLKAFYLKEYGTRLYMVVGMSMGAAIAFSMLLDAELHAENLVLDSGVFLPTHPVLLALNNRVQLAYKNKTRLREPKTLRQLQAAYGKELAPHYMELADHMNDRDLLTAANSVGRFALPAHTELGGTNLVAFHGTALLELQAKKCARYLKRRFPGARVKAMKGYGHCELSIKRPAEFLEEIQKAGVSLQIRPLPPG